MNMKRHFCILTLVVLLCLSGACSQDARRRDDVTSFLQMGNKKVAAGDYRGAIKDYDEAIRMNPNEVEAYYNSGIVKKELCDYIGAIADYSRVIELNPNLAEAYINRGYAKYNLGNYKGEIIDYEKAIELNPSYRETLQRFIDYAKAKVMTR